MEQVQFETNAIALRRRAFDSVRTTRCAYGQTADSYVLVVGGTPDWLGAPYTIAALVAPNGPENTDRERLYRAQSASHGMSETAGVCYDFVGEGHASAGFRVEIPEDYPASPALFSREGEPAIPLARLQFEQPAARAEWDHSLPEPTRVELPTPPRTMTVVYSALLNGGPMTTGPLPTELRDSA